ncbi:hypothetical protein E2C01_041063 [Portunus trituberculatus]|uniref:Uncharacterized protein n=1 Tax=Portunus trituberculatus TaxID=210409 RepID=A0A5B7FJ14_PORTR|nr:hypothetical protein [Portunus trituberculatus]
MSRAGLRVVLPPHLGRGPSPTPETRHRLQFTQMTRCSSSSVASSCPNRFPINQLGGRLRPLNSSIY